MSATSGQHGMSDGSALAGLRVLVATAGATERFLLASMLERAGMPPTLVASGAEALTALAAADPTSRRVDVLIADGSLPDMDGNALVTALRRRPGLATLPVVLLTTDPSPRDPHTVPLATPVRLGALVVAIESARTGVPVASSITPTAPADRIVDVVQLLARVEGDMELLRRLIGIFREQSERLLGDGWQAIARGDSAGLDGAAHALKSVVSHFSQGDAFTLAGDVEAMARSGVARASERWRDLESLIGRMRTALDRFGAAPEGTGAP